MDAYLCYRRRGAQTAKLFKRYMTSQGYGEVWYADDEACGKDPGQIPELMSRSACGILFIGEGFFEEFSGSLTELELTELEKRRSADPEFRILAVYLDRDGLTPEEASLLARTFRSRGIPESAEPLARCSRVFFRTARDYEGSLFRRLRSWVLYPADRVEGSFRFCGEKTSVDVIGADESLTVSFSEYSGTMPFYDQIAQAPSSSFTEGGDEQMVSVVGWESSRDAEGLHLLLSYRPVADRLFHKCIRLWDSPALKIRGKMQAYDSTSPGALFEIPNAMGLALMVVTSDRYLVFSRRSWNHRIRAGEYDCSLVEGLHLEGENPETGEYDIYDEDFVSQECLRAYREGIGDSEEGLELKLNGVLLDRSYGQWNLAGTLFTPRTGAQLRQLCRTDGRNELIFVKAEPEALAGALPELRHVGMWDTALAVLQMTLQRLGVEGFS